MKKTKNCDIEILKSVFITLNQLSRQALIINRLLELQEQFNLTVLFIVHDLSVVRHISDRIAVMYLGEIVEIASRIDLYRDPLHPYTKVLLVAVPIPNPTPEAQREHILIHGEIPSPLKPPSGCRFIPAVWKPRPSVPSKNQPWRK